MYLLTQRNTDFKLHSIWRSVSGDCESFYFNGCLPLRHPEVIPWRKEGDVPGTCNSGDDKTRNGKALVWPFGLHTCDTFHRRPWTQETSVFFLSAFIVFVPFHFALGHFQRSLFSHRAMEHSLRLNEHCPPPTLPNRAVSQMCYIQMNLAFSVPMGIFPLLKWQVTHLNLLPSFSPLPTIHQEHLGRSPTSRLSDSSSPTVSTIPPSCHSLPPTIPGNVIYREGKCESHHLAAKHYYCYRDCGWPWK